MRPMHAALTAILTVAIGSTGCTRQRGYSMLGGGTLLAGFGGGVTMLAGAASDSDSAYGAPAIGAPFVIGGGVLALAGLVMLAASGTSSAEAPRAAAPAPAHPQTRTLERAILRARAGNCEAALRLADEILDQDEAFYWANIRRDPTLARCVAARG